MRGGGNSQVLAMTCSAALAARRTLIQISDETEGWLQVGCRALQGSQREPHRKSVGIDDRVSLARLVPDTRPPPANEAIIADAARGRRP